jgi:hypothetical protein
MTESVRLVRGLRIACAAALSVVLALAVAGPLPARGADPDPFEPPANPFLADSPWPMSHRNSYNQASSPLPGPSGNDTLGVRRVSALPDAITLNYSGVYPDGSRVIWGSTFFSVFKARVTATGEIHKVDEVTELPDLSGGLSNAIASAYTVLDADNTLFAARQRKIAAYADAGNSPTTKIAKVREHAFPASVLGPGDAISAMNITFDGRLVVASKRGAVVAISRDFSEQHVLTLPAPEEVSNSIAVDEDGGIYVVTSDHMYRVQWTGAGLSLDPADGAWTAEYDGGPVVPAPGRLGRGSGTTPTLMGTGADEDKLVVIADGQTLMHIVAFWRDEIPPGWQPIEPGKDIRIAAELPITFGDAAATRSATEQSTTVRGHDSMVVSNTYGWPFDGTIGLGLFAAFFSGVPSIQPHGAELFHWDSVGNAMTSAWSNGISCPNGIPTMSAATGYAYCYGARGGVWTIEAFDWATGAPVFHHPLGTALGVNSFYAATEIGPDSSIVSGTLGGMIRVQPE